jgi:hypothetical protein
VCASQVIGCDAAGFAIAGGYICNEDCSQCAASYAK